MQDITNIAGSPGMSPFRKSPAKSPAPPPPPAEEETSTSAEETPAPPAQPTLGSKASSLRSSLPAYAAGHAAFLVLYAWNGSLISVAAWCFLATLLINGPYTMLHKPSKSSPPFAADDVSANVANALNLALHVFDRFKSGEPMLCFKAAVAAYSLALAAPYLPQPLVLAWMAYSYAAPDRKIIEQILSSAPPAANKAVAAAKEKALGLYTEHATAEPLRSLLAKLPEPILSSISSAQGVAKAHAGLIAFWPLAPLFAWGFLFSWFNKLLSAGMGLLAYKAWASKEANELLASAAKKYGEKTARTARRMSMAAGDLIMRRGTPSKPKEL
jgi:hypothetical protein